VTASAGWVEGAALESANGTSSSGALGKALGAATPGTEALPCDASAVQAKLNATIPYNNGGGEHLTGTIALNTAQMLETAAPNSVPYCRIDGAIHSSKRGVNDVHFQVSMPVPKYSGRYFQEGLGGSSGVVQPPRDDVLNEGFASGSTDRGATPTANPLNFSLVSGLCQACGYHLGAIAAERVTKAFYASPRLISYDAGCSAGGSDTRGNAVDYGTEDFQGVITGDNPSLGTLTLGYARIAKYLSDHPKGWISPTQLATVQSALLAKYDGSDGAVDGIIRDDRDFTVSDQVLRGAGLNNMQIAALRFVNDPWTVGLKNYSPKGMYVGFPLNSVSQLSLLFGETPPPWHTGQLTASAGFIAVNSFIQAVYGPSFDFNAHTFKQIAEMWTKTASGSPSSGATLPGSINYTAFKDHGGKIIFYQGNGDELVTPFDSWLTFRLLHAQRSYDQFARLYLIPGMNHCSGPLGPDDQSTELQLLNALVKWVENGSSPGSLTVDRSASTGVDARAFLLCPEPDAAVITDGNANDASAWHCAYSASFARCDGIQSATAEQIRAMNPNCPVKLT
jgi:feruloyl esterase